MELKIQYNCLNINWNDVAVLPEYQGKNVGRTIVNGILKCIPQCNFILYASPGKEIFYEKLNFRKMIFQPFSHIP
ncbi:GNAT family N-acetyltransferase [Clostridium sp. DJ247]|uniref:GNAT family N-acetyltransferase n=1 Tax=Clostridium sp. DJ247 TaxID=2726188 RepID=UPI0016262287|nr:GNAT family N-acetyltransferase [Clostridium sp. DJ247]MBC2579068.1 GNAT family N-acetyltransferase [Clostridium sp. DJ247]